MIVMRTALHSSTRLHRVRRGAAALDYILVLGVVLPMVLVIMRVAPRIIRSAYDMVCVLISWPFL